MVSIDCVFGALTVVIGVMEFDFVSPVEVGQRAGANVNNFCICCVDIHTNSMADISKYTNHLKSDDKSE